MKKLISMLLALTLVLAIVPTAFAADYVTYTFADGLTYSLGEGHSYDADNDIFRMQPGSGGKSGSYGNARHDQGGFISYVPYAATIPADTTYYVSFDIMRHTNNVNTLIRGMHEGDGRANYSPGLDIAANGDIKLNGTHWPAAGTVIGHLPAGEWHTLTFEYVLNSTSGDGARCNFYLDGNYMNYGINKYSANKNKGHVQLSLAVSSNSQYVLGADGAKQLSFYQVAGRGETVDIRNLTVSTDPSTFDQSAKVVSVNTRGAKNQIVFTTNKAVEGVDETCFTLGGGLTVASVAVNGKTITATLDSDMAENTEYSYSVYLGSDLFNGSFKTEWFEKIINTPSSEATLAVNSVGKQTKAVTGRYGEANGALAITNVQNNGGGSDSAEYSKYVTKVNYVHAPNKLTTIDDKDIKVSLDFMQGSSRVTSTLIALEQAYAADTKSVDYVPVVKLAADGKVTVSAVSQTPNAWTNGAATATADLEIATVNPKEWHNVTLAINVPGSIIGTTADVYFDGVLKYEDLRVAQGTITGFNGVSTTVIALNPSDEETAALTDPETGALYDAKDERRYDVIVVDNVYVGYNTEFNDSQMLLTEKSDGSAVNYKTGFVNRKNPVVSVLFDSTGAVKDIKTGLLWKEALGASSWVGGVTFDSAVAGDTIKTFAVASFTDLTPISNVLTKTVQ